eukprot:6208871-Pleurochrysis_carterae.AAC.1
MTGHPMWRGARAAGGAGNMAWKPICYIASFQAGYYQCSLQRYLKRAIVVGAYYVAGTTYDSVHQYMGGVTRRERSAKPGGGHNQDGGSRGDRPVGVLRRPASEARRQYHSRSIVGGGTWAACFGQYYFWQL